MLTVCLRDGCWSLEPSAVALPLGFHLTAYLEPPLEDPGERSAAAARPVRRWVELRHERGLWPFEAQVSDAVRWRFVEAGGSAALVLASDDKRVLCVPSAVIGRLPTEPDLHAPTWLVLDARHGLPLFVWPEPAQETERLLAWWQTNAAQRRPSLAVVAPGEDASVVLAALAERLTAAGLGTEAGVLALTDKVIEGCVALEHADGLMGVRRLGDLRAEQRATALVLAEAGEHPKALGLADAERGAVGSEALLPGNRRRQNVGPGFVLSADGDFAALVADVLRLAPRHVLTVGRHADAFARYLAETHGLDARALPASVSATP